MTDILLADAGAATPYQTTEHYLKRVLVGDIESVRSRVIAALERVGYDIVDDENSVIRGRRAAAGWGTFYSSADVLDYPRTLVVRLKPSGEHATRVTFDYLIKHPSLSAGEKDILTREAEAISSLATVRNLEKLCAACGTESTDDSRFCRRCGSPLTVESTELELLNMAAEVRAGYTSVVASEFILLASTLSIAIAFAAALVSGAALTKGAIVLFATGLLLAVMTMVFTGFGWYRFSRALKRKPKADTETSFRPPMSIDSTLNEDRISPGTRLPMSVVEGTTSLLDQNHTSPIELPLTGQKRITLSDLNDNAGQGS